MTTSPRKIDQAKVRMPRDDCFSAPVESFANEDFDFEKNLALFDKQAVFSELSNQGPCSKSTNNGEPKPNAKYKNDENVLRSKPAAFRQIKVPGSSNKEYVTDTGLVVPSVTYEQRQKLFQLAQHYGLAEERQIEIVGRSAGEMVLQLIGGSHR